MGPQHQSPTLIRRLARSAATNPDAIALSGDGDTSYQQLDRYTNQLAHHLRALASDHAGGERVVGICLERSSALITAILAVLKSGAAYLPIDPILPRERIRLMLADSGAAALITDDRLLRDTVGPLAIPVVRVDADRDRIAACATEPTGVQPEPA